ncbi:MAG: outer membrane lipoprotein-sorting protein [Candidatus Pacearchaeota archaeon]|nr:outer membrane lipoprotein-sorting protein [Candidatus Pacearchaeota archaeon]
MKIASILILLGTMFGYFLNAHAGVSKSLKYSDSPRNADEIARQVYFVNHFYAFSTFSVAQHPKGVAILINTAPDSPDRVLQIERHVNNTFNDGIVKSKEIAIIRDGKDKSTGMLIVDYEDNRPHDHFVWLPQLRKIKRFSQPANEESWAGSHFTYGDMTLRKPEDEVHRIIGASVFNQCLDSLPAYRSKNSDISAYLPAGSCAPKGKAVYQLESTNKNPDWWYDYRVSLVDTTSYADYRTEYYKDGKLIKIIDRDWRSMGMKDPRAQYWNYWYTRDLRNSHESEIIVPRVAMKYNHDHDNTFWSLKTLRQLRR